eukprot:TRINITY_DN733_c0_g1_i1.p2 TRINITY_DN733_c0_g1~~TRINITY_DN733_c0_g1_i1.p2  ORF type:complete len:212 (+),score=42.11 TRINITY_DN733_c0_g1_i1:62-637(+)
MCWAYEKRGIFDVDLPTLPVFLAQLFAVVMIEEVMFYYSHRALHQPPFYKMIHKQHHEWTAPMAWEAIYAHPLEHILSNILPIYTGVFIVKMHPVCGLAWNMLALHSTLCSHSGLHMPLMASPEEHDYHHATFNENFGVIGLLDQLHGTNARFLASPQYKNARISWSLVPLVHKDYLNSLTKESQRKAKAS